MLYMISKNIELCEGLKNGEESDNTYINTENDDDDKLIHSEYISDDESDVVISSVTGYSQDPAVQSDPPDPMRSPSSVHMSMTSTPNLHKHHHDGTTEKEPVNSVIQCPT